MYTFVAHCHSLPTVRHPPVSARTRKMDKPDVCQVSADKRYGAPTTSRSKPGFPHRAQWKLREAAIIKTFISIQNSCGLGS